MDCGMYIWLAALTVAAYYFTIAATKSEKRSSSFAAAAGACAMCGVMLGFILPAIDSTWKLVLAIVGGSGILLGVTAVSLAVRAYISRRHDRGRIALGGVIALLGGIASILVGSNGVRNGLGLLVPVANNPWTWKSDVHGFEVTLPSDRWTKEPNPNVPAQFRCKRPSLLAMVAEVRSAATDAEFEAAIAFGKKVRGQSALDQFNRSFRAKCSRPSVLVVRCGCI